ncbi:hypothetical protein [Nocardia sp. NPDC050710]|uniref:hypothetical protein n=1 Tax=Nocardia sp. NPDC050710 TaxID=3157220 RepID=UPI0033F924AC
MPNNNDLPPLLSPDLMPPIRTAEDLRLRWCTLLGGYTFTHRSLWCMFLAPDGGTAPVLPTIEPLPTWPDPVGLLNLTNLCVETLSACAPGGSVGFLLARPGPRSLRVSDRAWHHGLRDTARGSALCLRPIHLATDDEVRTLVDEDPMPTRENG